MRCGPLMIMLILSAGFFNPTQAQHQLFKNYTVNDGLVANSIRRIFQDKKGFLWIATWEGLSKYDGHSFTNFTTVNGLSHNMVNDFYESEKGLLYVALNNGSIDIISDDNYITKENASGTVINNIIQTPWQQLLVTTDINGLQVLTNGKLSRPEQLYSTATYTDIEIINDSTFIAAGGDVKVFNKYYKLLGETNEGLNKFSDVKILLDSKKRIWVGTNTGLKLIGALPQKDKVIHFATLPAAFNIPELTKTKINKIFEDADGILWFATVSGIVKINTDGSNQVITVKDGLSSNIVNTIFQDKEKNIWFGTEVGLSKLVTASGVRLFPIENGVASSDNAYLLYPFNKNYFLISTLKGVAVFNKSTGAFTTVINRKNQNFYSEVTNSRPALFIGSNNIFSFDTNRLQLNYATHLPESSVSRMVMDKAGNFFSSDLNHLFFGEEKTQRTLLNDRIATLLIDNAGYLWAGTWGNGLYRFKYLVADTGLQILSMNHYLPNENIRSFLNDENGNFWAGTRYHGLYLLKKKDTNHFMSSNFNQNHGLTSNFIKGIKEDAYGNFWLASNNGIDKLIKTQNGYRVFNFSRVNNYFTRIVGMEIDTDNTLWLATNEGLAKIEDAEMEKWLPQPVYITKVATSDSSYPLKSENVKLNYLQNQVQFTFSAPSYINEKQVLYSYRLMGNNTSNWSAASNNHVVSYASLQPADYRFEVRSQGWNGSWGNPAVFEFTINPPFWKTWWFSLAFLFSMLLLFYLFIKWRIKNIKTIEAEKLKVQQLNAEQYKSQLELEQIVNYFTSSLANKNRVEDVLWDVAKNLIGRLGFVDCIIYLWNEDKTKMIQMAGFGP